MNETIRLLHAHHCIRSFTDTLISDLDIDQIIRAGQLGPTSVNAQAVSVIVTRDKAKMAKVAEIAGGQPWVHQAPVFIMIVADFYKTSLGVKLAGRDQHAHENLEGFMAGALDVGITLANMMTAARALGLGVVPIGGLRKNPQAIIDLFGLPKLTFPTCGLTLGHIQKDVEQKPRLPIETFRHDERYNDAVLPDAIKRYDQTLMDYWQKVGRTDGEPWTKATAGRYATTYFEQVKIVAEKQGFLSEK